MRIDDYELSHLILRFEQEKDMKVMHAVLNLAALHDLVDLRIEHAGCKQSGCTPGVKDIVRGALLSILHHTQDMDEARLFAREALKELDGAK